MSSEEQFSSEGDASFNSFNNDGSFLEQFKRMQEQKKLEESRQNSKPTVYIHQVQESKFKTAATTSSFMPATLSSKRVTKGGAVIMKLSGVKRKSDQAVKLKKPLVASALGDDSSSEEDETGTKKEHKQSTSSSSSVATPTSSSTATVGSSSLGAQAGAGGLPLSLPASSSPSSSTYAQWSTGLGGGGAFYSNVGEASSSNVGGASTSSSSQGPQQMAGRKRKRASRWSDAPPSTEVCTPSPSSSSKTGKQTADDIAIAEAMASFDALPAQAQQKCHMTEAQLQQIREQIEMNRMVAEIQKAMKEAEQRHKNKFDYDSDEDTEGGTWEHKARMKEMEKTRQKAKELTEMNRGKHHISDFLPPEELEKFIERVKAIKEGRDPDFSDYKEHKITEKNVGFQLLQKAGWTEGSGLGVKEDGITAPINKGKRSFDQSGVGAEVPAEVKKEDDEFELYRKRMMLAYRFRPNPLNNPRRPYY